MAFWFFNIIFLSIGTCSASSMIASFVTLTLRAKQWHLKSSKSYYKNNFPLNSKWMRETLMLVVFSERLVWARRCGVNKEVYMCHDT